MEELKLKVDEFIFKHNRLEEKIDIILSKYNNLETKYNVHDKKTHRLLCNCEDYSPFIVNGSCRFCYGFNTQKKN
tara:strand:- start:293 stop:517 length:225 start_codon:yes stop_codon:yes gene_type:complete